MPDIYTYARRVAIAALVILLIMAGFYLLAQHAYFFLLVFAGILMAVMFCGMTDWLVDKAHLKRWLALLLSVVLFFGVLVATFWLIAPTIGKQVKEMQETVPKAVSQVEAWLNQYSWGQKIIQQAPDNLENVLPGQRTLLTQISGVFSSSLSFLADLLIVIITSLYFAASPRLYTVGFTKLFPVRRRTHILEVLYKCYETLKIWLLSMLAAMLLTGIAAAIGYKLIGLPLAFPLRCLLSSESLYKT